MVSVLYFASDTVKFVRGTAGKNRVKIKDAAVLRLPEGVLLNGIITDEGRLRESLAGLKGRLGKRVDIVVESGDILTKALEIPFLPPSAIRETVRREFVNTDSQNEDRVYDYAVLENRIGSEKRGRIFACAMNRSMLDRYRALFASLGITLSSCDAGLHALIKAVTLFPAFERSACVLSTIERDRMFCALFEGGRYVFSNSARIEAMPGTPEYGAGMAGRLSEIKQFYQSEKGGASLENVYFYGIDDKTAALCREAASSLHMRIEPFPESPRIACDETVDVGLYLAAVGRPAWKVRDPYEETAFQGLGFRPCPAGAKGGPLRHKREKGAARAPAGPSAGRGTRDVRAC